MDIMPANICDFICTLDFVTVLTCSNLELWLLCQRCPTFLLEATASKTNLRYVSVLNNSVSVGKYGGHYAFYYL